MCSGQEWHCTKCENGRKIKELEAFMKNVALQVGCLPAYAKPNEGNAHVYRAIQELQKLKAFIDRLKADAVIGKEIRRIEKEGE